jgi:hypothetical protein
VKEKIVFLATAVQPEVDYLNSFVVKGLFVVILSQERSFYAKKDFFFKKYQELLRCNGFIHDILKMKFIQILFF